MASLEQRDGHFRIIFRYGGRKFHHALDTENEVMQREKAALTAMTANRMGLVPIDLLIAKINRHLKGWMNYFTLGYPYDVFQKIGHHVRSRMIRHLRRRSQRPYRFPEGKSTYRFLAELGLMNPEKVYVNSRRKSSAKVSGNAGCGKSARPV